MIHHRYRILPDQLFLRNLRAEIARTRSHVAVCQLEPGACKRICELFRIFEEAARDLFVHGIEAQREIRGQHGRRVTFRFVVRVRNGAGTRTSFCNPLVGTGWAFGQFPFVAEEVPEKVVTPLRRCGRPGYFKSARDCVAAFACTEAALPSEALCFDRRCFRFGADMGCGSRTMGFAERVAARNQRDGFFVIHRHARKRFANVACCCERVRVSVRAFRVHIDQAHLHGRERIFKIAFSGIALVVQPLALRAPVHILIRLPNVLTSAAKTEGFESHRFKRDVAGKNHKVGPGNFAAILLFDRPEQTTRLVQADVVRPTVQRCKPLLAPATTAAAVANAVGAGAVPCHTDEQRPVVAEVCGPPVLRVGHQRSEVFLHRSKVEALEFFRVVEVFVHRVGLGGMLVQDVQPQLIRPPVLVCCAAAGDVCVCHRALGFFTHDVYSIRCVRGVNNVVRIK